MRSRGVEQYTDMRQKKSPNNIQGNHRISLPIPSQERTGDIPRHKLRMDTNSDPGTILQALLGNMNISVSVSDIETDKLLFASRNISESCPNCSDFKDNCSNCKKDGWERRFAKCDWEIERLPRRRDSETSGWPLVRELQDSTTGEWFLVTDSVITWTDGRTAAMQTSVKITELKKKEEALRKNVMTDLMTGAYNRAGGYAVMSEMLSSDAKAGVVSSLCFLDLDGLKYVNDHYGHIAGDEFIMSFVEAVRSSSRTSDIFCRWGGDEFLLYLHDCSLTHAEKIMCKISSEFEFMREHNGRSYPHRFSFGIVSIDPHFDDQDLDRVIDAADTRMYHNKKTRHENIRAAI